MTSRFRKVPTENNKDSHRIWKQGPLSTEMICLLVIKCLNKIPRSRVGFPLGVVENKDY